MAHGLFPPLPTRLPNYCKTLNYINISHSKYVFLTLSTSSMHSYGMLKVGERLWLLKINNDQAKVRIWQVNTLRLGKDCSYLKKNVNVTGSNIRSST